MSLAAQPRQTVEVRLLDAVSSTADGTQAVRAVVLEASGTGIPQGSIFFGHREGTPRADRLQLLFDRVAIGKRDYAVKARVLAVDNGRETVEPDGTIDALDPIRGKPGKVELLLLAAAHADPTTLAFLEGSKLTLRELDKLSVQYPAGTDMTLRFDEAAPPSAPATASGVAIPRVAPKALSEVLSALPLRTETYTGHTPSDWTNLAFAGSRAALEKAFAAAGWATAAALSLRADFKVFAAVAERHAYVHAPVSKLAIDGRLPDLVFEKQTNTFAKRHHIRIWLTSQTWEGKPVWIAAATHDIGINFSSAAKTFTHRIDGDVDAERHKVALDLLFAEPRARLYAQDRPTVPLRSSNATGDRTHTDGRLFAIVLPAD